MLPVYLEHHVELVLGAFPLNRRKPYLHRDGFPAVVDLHSIRHFGAHSNYSVTGDGQNGVDEIVLYLTRLVPCAIVGLALLLCYTALDVEDAALVVPRMGKTVYDYNAVFTYCRRRAVHEIYVALRGIGRVQRRVEELPDIEIAALRVEAPTLMLGIYQRDLAPVAGDTLGEKQRRQRFPRA